MSAPKMNHRSKRLSKKKDLKSVTFTSRGSVAEPRALAHSYHTSSSGAGNLSANPRPVSLQEITRPGARPRSSIFPSQLHPLGDSLSPSELDDLPTAFCTNPTSRPSSHASFTLSPSLPNDEPPQRCPSMLPTAAQSMAMRSDEEVLSTFFLPESSTMLRKSIRDFLDSDDIARLSFLTAAHEYTLLPPHARKAKAFNISVTYLMPEAPAPLRCDTSDAVSLIETMFDSPSVDQFALFDPLVARVSRLFIASAAFQRWRKECVLESSYMAPYPFGREWNFRHCYFRALPYFALPPRQSPYDTEYHANHALWAINMACLVYLDPPDIHHVLTQYWGYDFFEFIEAPSTGTQLMVTGTKDVLFVAFRGTESAEDWKTNQDYKLIPLFEKPRRGSALLRASRKPEEAGGPLTEGEVAAQKLSHETMVHRGFRTAFVSISKHLDAVIAARRSEYPNSLIYLTGHSLGGALTTLCIAHFLCRPNPIPIHGAYTFGQPRVGNPPFEKLLSNASKGFGSLFRVVNCSDIVPKLPPGTFGFKHVGVPVLITSQKELLIRPSKELFKAESSGVGGGLINHTKNEYLACYEILRYADRSQYIPPSSKGLFILKDTRGIDLSDVQLIARSRDMTWTKNISPDSKRGKTEEDLLLFQLPEIYSSDHFTIEIWHRSSKQCLGYALVGLDQFEDQPDQRIPLTSRPNSDDGVSSLAAIILDARYFPLLTPSPLVLNAQDDLHAPFRTLNLIVHSLQNTLPPSNEPNTWTVLTVRHQFREWVSPKMFPLSALNYSLSIPYVTLDDYLHLDFYSFSGSETTFLGRLCLEISHGFFNFHQSAFSLQELLDPKPGVISQIQGQAVLSFSFLPLPVISPACFRPVATATITLHRIIDVIPFDNREEADRQFYIRASSVGHSWTFLSPKLINSATSWNLSFVVPKMSVSSPLEIELIEQVAEKFDSQGRVVLQFQSLHEDVVSQVFPLSMGKRVGKFWSSEECSSIGFTASGASITSGLRATKGALELSLEFKPCTDVVRRTAGLATGKTRILKVSVRTPRFLREMGVPQKVSLAISPTSTVQSAIEIIIHRLTKGMSDSQSQLLSALQSFVLAVLSYNEEIQVLPSDTLLWNLLATTRLVFLEGSTLNLGPSPLAPSTGFKRVAIKVSMTHWSEFLSTPFVTISCYTNESIAVLISKLCKKIASLIPDSFQRTLALKIARGCCMYRSSVDSPDQSLEAISEHCNLSDLSSCTLYFAPNSTIWEKPQLTPRGSSADVSREDLYRASRVISTPSPSSSSTKPAPTSPSWRQARRSLLVVNKLSTKSSPRSWFLATGPPPIQSDVPRFFTQLPCPIIQQDLSSFRDELFIVTSGRLFVHVRSWTVIATLSKETRSVHADLASSRLYGITEDGRVDVYSYPHTALQQATTRDVMTWKVDDIHAWLTSLDLPSSRSDLIAKNISLPNLLSSDPSKSSALFGFDQSQTERFKAAQNDLTISLSSAKFYLPSLHPKLPSTLLSQVSCPDKIKSSWVRCSLITTSHQEIWMGTVASGRDLEDECGQLLIFNVAQQQFDRSILLPHAAGCLMQMGSQVWAGGAGKITVVDMETRRFSSPVNCALPDDIFRNLCCVTFGKPDPSEWQCWAGTDLGKIFVFDHNLKVIEVLSDQLNGRIITIRYCQALNLILTVSFLQGSFFWDPQTRDILLFIPLPQNIPLISAELVHYPGQNHVQLWLTNTDLETSLVDVFPSAQSSESFLSTRAPSIPESPESSNSSTSTDRSLQIEQRLQAIREKRRLSSLPPVTSETRAQFSSISSQTDS